MRFTGTYDHVTGGGSSSGQQIIVFPKGAVSKSLFCIPCRPESPTATADARHRPLGRHSVYQQPPKCNTLVKRRAGFPFDAHLDRSCLASHQGQELAKHPATVVFNRFAIERFFCTLFRPFFVTFRHFCAHKQCRADMMDPLDLSASWVDVADDPPATPRSNMVSPDIVAVGSEWLSVLAGSSGISDVTRGTAAVQAGRKSPAINATMTMSSSSMVTVVQSVTVTRNSGKVRIYVFLCLFGVFIVIFEPKFLVFGTFRAKIARRSSLHLWCLAWATPPQRPLPRRRRAAPLPTLCS